MEKTQSKSTNGLMCLLVITAVVILIVINGVLLNRADCQNDGDKSASGNGQAANQSETADLPTSVELTAVSEFLVVGKTMEVSAEILPAKTDDIELIWDSSDEAVASVDSSGVVTANAKGSAYITVRTETGLNDYIVVNVIEPATVYFSPSAQKQNTYPVGNTDESTQSSIIAEHCRKRLALAGVDSIICTNDIYVENRGKDAVDKDADYYVAIHTGDTENKGIRITFYRRLSDSTRMSVCIKDNMKGTLTADDNIELICGTGIGKSETDRLGELKVPAIFIEAGDHTTAEGAQWIIDNSEKIGNSIADGILDLLLLPA